MQEEIIVIGALGTSLNIIEQIDDAYLNYNHYQKVKGICIDSYPVGEKINGFPVLCNTSNLLTWLNKNVNVKVLFALYKPNLLYERYKLLQSYKINKNKFTNFIHPKAYVSQSIILGFGNVILSNSTMQSNIIFGNFNIVNSNVTIEHDTTIGNGNFIAANSVVGSNVLLKSNNFIGLNSSIIENVQLDNVFIGMHSLVLNSFRDDKIYGIPARSVL